MLLSKKAYDDLPVYKVKPCDGEGHERVLPINMLFPLLHVKEQAESSATQGVTDSTVEPNDVVPPVWKEGNSVDSTEESTEEQMQEADGLRQ